MQYIGFIIMSIITLGCVEPIEYYIDQNCTAEEQWAATAAFEALNDVLGYEHAIIIDKIEIDYAAAAKHGSNHVVMCISDHDTASMFAWGNHMGWYHADDIAIRADWTTDEYGITAFQRVLRHELIHLVGARNGEHSDNPDDIFGLDPRFGQDSSLPCCPNEFPP
jgi:hypothetical protein